MKSFFVFLLLVANCSAANFRVFCQDKDLAKQVYEKAHALRSQHAKNWLGHDLPDWDAPCSIQVLIATSNSGVTSFVYSNGTVGDMQMTVRGTKQGILEDVLPHEVLHTVFAEEFRQAIPRWADEGACTIEEGPVVKARLNQLLATQLKTKRGIPFTQLFTMTEYPSDMLALYTHGYSLSDFLVCHSGKQDFVKFIKEGIEAESWTTEVKIHYGYGGLADLQSSWLDWIRAGSPRPAVSMYQDSTDGLYAGLIFRNGKWCKDCANGASGPVYDGQALPQPLVPVQRPQPISLPPAVNGYAEIATKAIKELDELKKKVAELEKRLPTAGAKGPTGDPGPVGGKGAIGDKGPVGDPGKPADLADLNKQIADCKKQLAAFELRLNQNIETPSGTAKPKLSHFVLIIDRKLPSWSRTESELVRARKTFPNIHVVPVEQIPFTLEPLPQLVAYDTTGAPMFIERDTHDVENALRLVARNELK